MDSLLFAFSLDDISIFQWGFIAIAAVVVYQMFIKKTPSTAQVAQPISPINPFSNVVSPLRTEIKLETDPTVELVTRWKALRNYTSDSGLSDAVKKLDELFPLLNGVKTDATSTTK